MRFSSFIAKVQCLGILSPIVLYDGSNNPFCTASSRRCRICGFLATLMSGAYTVIRRFAVVYSMPVLFLSASLR